MKSACQVINSSLTFLVDISSSDPRQPSFLPSVSVCFNLYQIIITTVQALSRETAVEMTQIYSDLKTLNVSIFISRKYTSAFGRRLIGSNQEANRINTPTSSDTTSPFQEGIHITLNPQTEIPGTGALVQGLSGGQRVESWQEQRNTTNGRKSRNIFWNRFQVAEFELRTPEHLPSSPLCPKNLNNSSGGTGICLYHGGRSPGDLEGPEP